MTELEARQAIAVERMALYNDESLPVELREMYKKSAERVLDGSDKSFTTWQKIQYLTTGIEYPLLPK